MSKRIVTDLKDPELEPLPRGLPLAELPALLRSLPHLDPDNAEAFAVDIDRARQEITGFPVHGAWAS